MTCFKSIIAMGCLLVAGSMHAASLLVAGTDFDPLGLDLVSNAASGGQTELDQLFTLSSSVQLTSLILPAGSFSAQTLEIQLFRGDGFAGGTLLQTTSILIPGVFDGLTADVPTVTAPISLGLGSGSYSLLFSDSTASSDFIYLQSALSANTPAGSLGGVFLSDSPGLFQNVVFELDGNVISSVPEPGVTKLLASAFLLLGLMQLFRRRTSKLNNNAAFV